MARTAPSAPLRSLGLCPSCRTRLLPRTTPFHRPLSTTARHQNTSDRTQRIANQAGQTAADPADAPPRWARTPQAMRAPFKTRPAGDNDTYACNEDPAKLDRALGSMLGVDVARDGVLPDEVKWLAVTHKSFDHGRRGFNDRLAFLGKRIVELQTDLALLDAPQPTAQNGEVQATVDAYGREIPREPALEGVEKLTAIAKDRILDKERMARLAERYGLNEVVRWKPKQVNNLKGSGIDTVLTHVMYAIIGAVALQRGGDAAVQTVRERVLRPLGAL